MENIEILYEGIIKFINSKSDILLTITKTNIIFKKKTGFFKKKYKVVKDILIKDIKVIKDKSQVIQKDSHIVIYTSNDNFEFVCNNVVEAKKIKEEINKVIFNDNLIGRISKKSIKIAKGIGSAAISVGIAAGAAASAVKAYKENKNVVVESFKTILNLIKK